MGQGTGEIGQGASEEKTKAVIKDSLDQVLFYRESIALWDLFWDDSEIMMKDLRGREMVKQLTRSVYSISANIEEGYGRGFGKEYPQFLRYARGSARETKGGYEKAKRLLPANVVEDRIERLQKIIGAITKTLKTLSEKQK
ncbi:MAG: four helix bundle protein [Bacteroidetes bacterium]|nr:four helix bundle protein [Bacteroidota bacterium]